MREFLAILAALLAYDLTKAIGRALQRWYLRLGERVPLTTARPVSRVNPPDHW